MKQGAVCTMQRDGTQRARARSQEHRQLLEPLPHTILQRELEDDRHSLWAIYPKFGGNGNSVPGLRRNSAYGVKAVGSLFLSWLFGGLKVPR